MQTDVKAASNTASATFYAGPTRVRGIVVTSGAAAGTLVISDGGSGGTAKINHQYSCRSGHSKTY